MKKLTLAIAAIVMGFVMASCDTTSKKDTIMNSADEFFTQAEEKVQAIESGEDFMAYFQQFADEKADFLQKTFGPYMDEEGNVKGFTEEEWDEIQNFIYDRATAYNKVEGAKCAEFLTPAIERYEKAVDAFWAKYQAGENLDEETFNAMFAEMDQAEDGVFVFAEYDNIPTELQERYSAAAAKQQEMFSE